MQIKTTNLSLERVKADIFVLCCWQKKKDKDDKGSAVLQKSDGGVQVDAMLGGLLSKIIATGEFRADAGTCKVIHTHGKIPARTVILAGLGTQKEFKLNTLRKIGGKLVSLANELKAESLASVSQAEAFGKFAAPSRIEALVEGFILGGYKFERYKDKKETEPDTLKTILLISKGNAKKLEDAIHRGGLLAEAVNFVRDLVNTPAKDLTPNDLANIAKATAKESGLTCTVWGPKEIKAAKMELFLSVARGSENEPRFVHMSYKPKGKAKASVALIGKGITFDTGGYDLKPGRYMLHMQDDMAGAAICIAVMKVLASLKPGISADAYLPLTDNMIDAKATVPGDIFRARNGKTVEIISTDAEGRLVLADAISYAAEKKPDVMVDVATLTGGVLYALGEIYTAILGNNQKIIDKFLNSAREEEEPTWQLPLAQEYKKGLKDGPADLKNVAKSRADTIVGALFLEEFAGDSKWIHLDIAESSWTEEDNDFVHQGATGSTVRSIIRFLTTY
jgi:leucyl aminopeptidase